MVDIVPVQPETGPTGDIGLQDSVIVVTEPPGHVGHIGLAPDTVVVTVPGDGQLEDPAGGQVAGEVTVTGGAVPAGGQVAGEVTVTGGAVPAGGQVDERMEVIVAGEHVGTPPMQLPLTVETIDTVLAPLHCPVTVVVVPTPGMVVKTVDGVQVPWTGLTEAVPVVPGDVGVDEMLGVVPTEEVVSHTVQELYESAVPEDVSPRG